MEALLFVLEASLLSSFLAKYVSYTIKRNININYFICIIFLKHFTWISLPDPLDSSFNTGHGIRLNTFILLPKKLSLHLWSSPIIFIQQCWTNLSILCADFQKLSNSQVSLNWQLPKSHLFQTSFHQMSNL